MSSRKNDIWFPAKKYGFGWGPPTCWQGWVVVGIFIGLITAGAFVIPMQDNQGAFIAYAVALSIAMIFVCWLKGEKPRWRWGNDRNPPSSKKSE